MSGSKNKLSLLVVVNSTPTPVEANVNAPLHTVVQHALSASGSTGRELSEWEFKDVSGRLLDLDRKVGEFGFADGAELFLTPRVGVNGNGAR